MKRLATFGLLLTLATPGFARDQFSICWSIYVGWMPWAYGAEQGIVDKWADKYDISIDVVQINDYIESINQYTAGQFDGCTMTNMDALTIPAAGGVDSVSHYLLARALDSVGMSERDVQVVNTSDADLVGVYASDDVTSVVTWNPLLSEIETMPDSNKVFDSSSIPGEIIDLLVVNTQTLEENPDFGKALTGAWYEIMATMAGDDDAAIAAKTFMADASGTDLAGFEAQLASTSMFYTPAEAVAFSNSDDLKTTMQYVAEFSFTHGLLGDGAPDAGFIGIDMPSGALGDEANTKLRFNPSFMQMAADGAL